jgi:hypothetical protein
MFVSCITYFCYFWLQINAINNEGTHASFLKWISPLFSLEFLGPLWPLPLGIYLFQIELWVLFQQIHGDILDFIGFILMSKLVVVPTRKHNIC